LLRRHIRSFIDRRFCSEKYDARKTLDAFATELRAEATPDALGDDLIGDTT
jgi:hypothetical protein